MTRMIALVVAAFLLSVSGAEMVGAQCSFEHPRNTALGRPRKENSLTTGLVPAFVSCNNPGGRVPDGTTEDLAPSCLVPETYTDRDGSPSAGWRWHEQRSTGSLIMYPTKNRLDDALNPPANSVDVSVKMNLRSVLDGVGPADGFGKLALVLRTSFEDRAYGPMTVIDFPLEFPFELRNGNVSLRTTVNARWNAIGLHGMPHCSVMEIVSVRVIDERGVPFAVMGSFLPPL